MFVIVSFPNLSSLWLSRHCLREWVATFTCVNPDAARLGCCDTELSIQQEACNSLSCLGFTLKVLLVFSADGVFLYMVCLYHLKPRAFVSQFALDDACVSLACAWPIHPKHMSCAPHGINSIKTDLFAHIFPLWKSTQLFLHDVTSN